MKVVYQKTIVDKIREAEEEAKKQGKRIEKIEVTPSEWTELLNSFPQTYLNINYSREGFYGQKMSGRWEFRFGNITVVCEDKQ